MKDDIDKAPNGRVRPVSFPWLSTVGALLVIAYLLFLIEPELGAFYGVPEDWWRAEVKYAVLGLFVALLIFDLRRYSRQHVRQKTDLTNLRGQVDTLWQDKKRLQLKAHTYSGHADKLKLFISDKLLEYIEYDEKFLHFKSIAAEVRHNGVISFDKVQTALQRALAETPDSREYREALDAMRYLWDLLDLSTADNLALHIGNLLCECEEHYCQRLLQMEDAAPLPYEPAYSPQHAAWRALALVRQEALQPPEPGTDYLLDESRWYVWLAPAGELLGKENHLVLLLENLLKNAQFFSSRRGYKSPFAPVALTLREEQGEVYIRVYNRGPHIREEDFQNLFQLGFSTRRTREHHGRGLGLYFVNEIVKGYEGRIEVRNILTPETRYTVRVELEDGDVNTELIDIEVHDGQPRCRSGDGGSPEVREWTFKSPVRSVEVTLTGSRETRRLEDFDKKGRQTRFDPAHAGRPCWQIDYQPRRNTNQLTFRALDVSGVEFEIRLPTARLRLDGSGAEADDDIDAEVGRLDQRFRAQANYDGER
ncbi:histidine kinase [Thioalkalivibrio denitrificans]|uniref:histidine kinase n=1 Tax=Thioalkalivibrio denitrificans TaxID=108003 RepID=A0A1V3NCW8_9GAMM|nr:ATP-binding protein [Thioalkalivibrio denitrificans]OOG22783.1 histidine kinase [Thioalkalivibrio denitrificans]